MDLIPWRNKARGGRGEQPLATFRSELDSLFDRFFRDPWGTSLASLSSGLAGAFPQLDMTESDNEVTVRAELPGVQPNDVRIEVTGNVLKLSGEKSEERTSKGKDYRYSERQFGSFSRAIQLPTGVEASKVDATYKDGVLTITLPKDPAEKPKRITVRNA